MNEKIETEFVDKFVVKDKRERVKYGLASKKKREETVLRLPPMLDERLLVFSDWKNNEAGLIEAAKKLVNVNSKCYVIADGSDDGKELDFKQAFARMSELENSYILLCEGNTVIAADEYCADGAPLRRIYHRKEEI